VTDSMSDESDDGGAGKRFLERVADMFSGEPTSRSELMETLRFAADRDLIDVDVLNILFGAIGLAEMHVRDVMIPRSELVCVRADASPRQFLPIIVESQHSRFPVIGDDVDDVRGILHAKDVLPLLIKDDWADFDIKDCMRPASVIPESKRLNVLLQDFRTNRNHMAVVIDEYGHISGAVTIEDVLEQIVGDIEDEHDVEDHADIKELGGDNYTVKATTTIVDFNERFGTDFSGAEFDTIGGLLMKHFGHLPKRDESIAMGDLMFEVLNADSRRIRLMRVYPVVRDH
jgi:magnesium and cobalt transporter